jgi:hypothetical protein
VARLTNKKKQKKIDLLVIDFVENNENWDASDPLDWRATREARVFLSWIS